MKSTVLWVTYPHTRSSTCCDFKKAVTVIILYAILLIYLTDYINIYDNFIYIHVRNLSYVTYFVH